MFEINDKDEMKTDSCVSTLSAVQHLEERLTLTIEMNENAQDFYLSKANARLLRAELDGFLGEEEKGTNTEKQFVISYLTPIRGVTKDRAIAYAKRTGPERWNRLDGCRGCCKSRSEEHDRSCRGLAGGSC